jgi:hypothetical protein
MSDEELDEIGKLLATMGAQSGNNPRPRHATAAAMPQRAGSPPPMAPQMPAQAESGIKAPDDRGMFGRFMGGLGKVGKFAMYGPVGMDILHRDKMAKAELEQKEAEKESKLKSQLQMLSEMPGLTDQQRMLILNGLGVEQAAESAFAPPPERKDPIEINGQLVDPYTYEPIGDFRDPQKPIEVNGQLVDPITFKPVGDFRTPAQKGEMTDYERAKLEADATAAEAEAAAGPEINVDDEASFRREYNSITSGFRDVQSSYGRIKATDATTPAGQLSLVYQYMKMLDPGSTVMQGEQASASNAAGVPDRVKNLYNSIIQGKPLSAAQVTDFTNQADRLYVRSLQDYDQARTTYEGLAGMYGFDAARTVPDLATGRAVPAVGNDGVPNMLRRPGQPATNRRIGPSGQPVPDGFE